MGTATLGVFGPLHSGSKEDKNFLMVAFQSLTQEGKSNSRCSQSTFDSKKLVGYTLQNQKMLPISIGLKQPLCFSFSNSVGLIDMRPSTLTTDAPAAIASHLTPPLPHGSLSSVRILGPAGADSGLPLEPRVCSTSETVRTRCCCYTRTLFWCTSCVSLFPTIRTRCLKKPSAVSQWDLSMFENL